MDNTDFNQFTEAAPAQQNNDDPFAEAGTGFAEAVTASAEVDVEVDVYASAGVANGTGFANDGRSPHQKAFDEKTEIMIRGAAEKEAAGKKADREKNAQEYKAWLAEFTKGIETTKKTNRLNNEAHKAATGKGWEYAASLVEFTTSDEKKSDDKNVDRMRKMFIAAKNGEEMICETVDVKN